MSAQAKYQAEDKEKLERGAKNCWNRMTRFLDKTSEILFVGMLGSQAILS